ncbi:SDR family NAD(P)-dependent oxidoreductase [Hamadaea tsunoensis]|uniref:SDR family NAD(P)-dependent oxidoreductase n=1 Tax=Hamadaea tsunoensis TaxID=53368 RepID=UPI000421CB7D|nr:SDR family NAD(P)-dependent oxidoreductase [Hamadaea tsunoensis]
MATVADSTILITGANRGIGRALVDEALARGARRVYAGTRTPFTHSDPRVVPLTLEVTDADAVRAAAETIPELDILVNNAGIAQFDDLSDAATIQRHLDVNLFGPHTVIHAFLPQLTAAKGAIVNNLSMNSLAPIPFVPAYSVSKAAAFSLTQSLRALLGGRDVSVHAVLTGPVDTDMSREFQVPKATPAAVAQAIFDGVEKGEEDIFPDPLSAQSADGWRTSGMKALEREFAALAS